MKKIRLLKILDRFIGLPAVKLLREPRREKSDGVSSLLIIRPGGMGDALLLSPVLQSIKRQNKGIVIDVLAEKRNGEVFSLLEGVRNVYRYDHFDELVKVLSNRYDAVIDTEQWYCLSAVVARLVRATIRVGFATNERARMFTHKVNYDLDMYEMEMFSHLIEPLGLSKDVDLSGPPGPANHSRGENVNAGACLEERNAVVVIFPGASVEQKRWGNDNFRDLAKKCLRHGWDVVVVGGVQEIEAGKEISRGLLVVDKTGATSLEETMTIIRDASVVVTTDSSILHLTTIMGQSTVSLFGASPSRKWAPRGSGHIVLDKSLDCSPCSIFGNIPQCKNDLECMQRISVSEVVFALEKLLGGTAEN